MQWLANFWIWGTDKMSEIGGLNRIAEALEYMNSLLERRNEMLAEMNVVQAKSVAEYQKQIPDLLEEFQKIAKEEAATIIREAKEAACKHERLNEEGYCRFCGADRR